jgi:hypothetical protein
MDEPLFGTLGFFRQTAAKNPAVPRASSNHVNFISLSTLPGLFLPLSAAQKTSGRRLFPCLPGRGGDLSTGSWTRREVAAVNFRLRVG